MKKIFKVVLESAGGGRVEISAHVGEASAGPANETAALGHVARLANDGQAT